MGSIISLGKDLIDIFGALVTPGILIFGAYIAWQQHNVNKNRLRFELFDKRYDLYEKIGSFIANILINGNLEKGAEIEFLRDTKSSYILFDNHIKEFASELYKNAVELHALDARLETLRDEDERTLNINRQTNIKNWYQEQLNNMEEKFVEYLKLEH